MSQLGGVMFLARHIATEQTSTATRLTKAQRSVKSLQRLRNSSDVGSMPSRRQRRLKAGATNENARWLTRKDTNLTNSLVTRKRRSW